MPPLKVALYARVSTKDQNAEAQLTDLRRYCNAREWVIQREFLDLGISGSKDDRPALKDLMEFVRKRRADTVLVWRLDRFGRSTKHLLNTLGELMELGINFVSFSENLDTTTSTGRLHFTILSAFAEFERESARERIFMGLRRAKELGHKSGPKRLVDSVLDADRLRVARAIELRNAGRSLRGIEAETDIPLATLSRLFQDHPKIEKKVTVGDKTENLEISESTTIK